MQLQQSFTKTLATFRGAKLLNRHVYQSTDGASLSSATIAPGHIAVVWQLPPDATSDSPPHLLAVLDELPSRTPCHHPAVLRLLKAWHGAPLPADPTPLPSDEGLLLSAHTGALRFVQFHAHAGQQLLTAVEGDTVLHMWSCSYASGFPQWSHVVSPDLPTPPSGGALQAAHLDLPSGKLILVHTHEEYKASGHCDTWHSISSLPFSASAETQAPYSRRGAGGAPLSPRQRGSTQIKVVYGMEASILVAYSCAGKGSTLQLHAVCAASSSAQAPPSAGAAVSQVFAVVTGAPASALPPAWRLTFVRGEEACVVRCPPRCAPLGMVAAGACPASGELVLLARDGEQVTVEHLGDSAGLVAVDQLLHPEPYAVEAVNGSCSSALQWLPSCPVHVQGGFQTDSIQPQLAVQAHCLVVLPASDGGCFVCVDRASGAVLPPPPAQRPVQPTPPAQPAGRHAPTAPVLWNVQPFGGCAPPPGLGCASPLQALPAPPLDGSERYQGNLAPTPSAGVEDDVVLPASLAALPPFMHLVCSVQQATAGSLQQRRLDSIAGDLLHASAVQGTTAVPADASTLPLDVASGLLVSTPAGAAAVGLPPVAAYAAAVAVVVAGRSRKAPDSQAGATPVLRAAAMGHLAAVSSLRFITRGLQCQAAQSAAPADLDCAKTAVTNALTAHAMAAVALIRMEQGPPDKTSSLLPPLLPQAVCGTAAAVAAVALGDEKSAAWRAFSMNWGPRVEAGGSALQPVGRSVDALQLTLCRWGEERLFAAAAAAPGARGSQGGSHRPAEELLWECARHLLLTSVCHPTVLLSVAACAGGGGVLGGLASLLLSWAGLSGTPADLGHSAAREGPGQPASSARKASTVSAAFESLQDVLSADLRSGGASGGGVAALPFGDWGPPRPKAHDHGTTATAQLFALESEIASRAHALFGVACDQLASRSPSARAALRDLASVLHSHQQVSRDMLVDAASAAFVVAFPGAGGSLALLTGGPHRSGSAGSGAALLPMFASGPRRASSNSFVGTADSTKLAALMDQHGRGGSVSTEGGQAGALLRAQLPVPSAVLQLLLPSDPLALAQLLSQDSHLQPAWTKRLEDGQSGSGGSAALLSALMEQLGVSACLELPAGAPTGDLAALLHPLLLAEATPGSEAWGVQAALVRCLFWQQPQLLPRLAVVLRRMRSVESLAGDAAALGGVRPGQGGGTESKAPERGGVDSTPCFGARLGVFQAILGMLPRSDPVAVPQEHISGSVENFRGMAPTTMWQLRVRARLLRAAGQTGAACRLLADSGLFGDALQMLRDCGAAGDEARSISVRATGNALRVVFGWEACVGTDSRAIERASSPAVAIPTEHDSKAAGAEGGSGSSPAQQSTPDAPRTPSKFARMMQDARRVQELKPQTAPVSGGARPRRHSRGARAATAHRSPSPGGSDGRSTRSRGTSASFSAEQEAWGRGTAPLDSILFDLLGDEQPKAKAAASSAGAALTPAAAAPHPPHGIAAHVRTLGQMVAQGTAPIAADLSACYTALLQWCLQCDAAALLRQVLLHTPARFSAASLHAMLQAASAHGGLQSAVAAPQTASRGGTWSDSRWRHELGVLSPGAASGTSAEAPPVRDTIAGMMAFLRAVQREAVFQRTQGQLSDTGSRGASQVLLRGFA